MAGRPITLDELQRQLAAAEERASAAEASLHEISTRHRLLIQLDASGMETDPDGVVVNDSPSWRAYTGQTVEEWLGYGWLDTIHLGDREYAEKQWKDAAAAQGVVDPEFRLRSPDGDWRWTNLRAALVRDREGNIQKWVGINIDIDARKRLEVVTFESEQRYHALFESMDEAFAVVEVLKNDERNWYDLRFVEVNSAFTKHTTMPWPVGKTATELLGTPNPRRAKLYGEALDTGKPIRIEEPENTLGIIFDLNIFPLDRKQNRVAVLFTNISARKKAERSLRESEQHYSYLLKLSDLLQRSIEPADFKSAAMHLLGEHLGVSRAQYHEVDSSGDFYGAEGIGYSNGLPLLDLKYRIGQFGSFVAEDFEAGRPFRSDHLQADPRPTPEEKEAYDYYGIRAGAGIPLLRSGKLVAILAVHDQHIHAWTNVEMELIRETAERVWLAMEKVRNALSSRQDEERQAFLLSFSDRLRAETNPDAIAQLAVELLGAHLQLDRCYLANCRLEDDRADIAHQFGTDLIPPMPATIRLSDFPQAFRVVFDSTLVINDVTADQSLSDTERASIAGLGLRALVAPTLRKGPNRPHWVIVAVSAHPRHWTPGEIKLTEEVAERTWVAVERAHAESALRDSEQRFRQFGRASSDDLWIRDAATLKLEFASDAMETIYGLSIATMTGGRRVCRSSSSPDTIRM